MARRMSRLTGLMMTILERRRGVKLVSPFDAYLRAEHCTLRRSSCGISAEREEPCAGRRAAPAFCRKALLCKKPVERLLGCYGDAAARAGQGAALDTACMRRARWTTCGPWRARGLVCLTAEPVTWIKRKKRGYRMDYGVTITRARPRGGSFSRGRTVRRAFGWRKISSVASVAGAAAAIFRPCRMRNDREGPCSAGSTGESVVPWTECTVLDSENWTITFPQVPAGGLYRIETYMDYEGWDGLSCTRGDMVHNVGVGDVFVIAGQSNAAGRAKTQ